MITEGTLLTILGVGLTCGGSLVNSRKQDLATEKAVAKYLERREKGEVPPAKEKSCRFRKKKKGGRD